MGARQRAHKRGKGTPKAARGSLKGSPSSQKKANHSIQVPSLEAGSRGNALQGWQDFALSSSPGNRYGMSMGQEARNTERHVFGWGTTKLRESGITFVSAGHLHQDEWQKAPQENDSSGDGMNGDVKEEQPAQVPPEPTQSPRTEITVVPSEETRVAATQQVPEPALMPNQQSKSDLLSVNFNTHRARATSVSSSGSDQIVFTGRSNSRIPSQIPSRDQSSNEHDAGPQSDVIDSIEMSSIPVGRPEPTLITTEIEVLSTSPRATPSGKQQRYGRRDRRGRRRPQNISDEEEAIIQDYIANMAVDDSSDEQQHTSSKPVRKNETLRFYNGSGEENAKVQIQHAKHETPRDVAIQDLDQAMDWNSDDLEIFDDVSTSDEDMDEIEQVLRQRDRSDGLQYLVTGKNRGIEDAKWIPIDRLTSASAVEEIRIFEELQNVEFEDDTVDDGDSPSDSEEIEALDDLIDNIESEDDENARILAHTSRMTDEQIARALAKQEELGMGADELVLFDGNIGLEDEADGMHDPDAFGQGDDFIAFSTKQHTSNRNRSKRNKKQRDIFPPATAFADALDEDPYGGFDIMDFDRPSLRPRKKGRKSGFPYDIELDDDELKDQLVSTWIKDREKKTLRKREKEEARLAAAFDASERSQPAVIKAEIRRFLCQEIDVLRLAPMDSATRASVHRIAKALRLNSRSEGVDGKGAGRYPVLSKTVRTPSYTINNIWEVDALLNTRKFFPKNSTTYKSSKFTRGTITRTQRSGGIQGASYMNGEVVGASAPELGADNKGRAMLEKMGWTSGMGIGAEGNKGGLEAIKHVVKTTKAGLG